LINEAIGVIPEDLSAGFGRAIIGVGERELTKVNKMPGPERGEILERFRLKHFP
jgi:hypothetical protein